MQKESVILGTLLLVAGIVLYQIKAPAIPSIILIIFGAILIVFPHADKLDNKNKEEKGKTPQKKGKTKKR